MTNFEYFKNGVGGQLMARAGFDVSNLQTWKHLAQLIHDNAPESIDALKKAHSCMSSGERPIIQAVLWAADYARQADELSNGYTYYSIASMSGEHRKTYFAIPQGEA